MKLENATAKAKAVRGPKEAARLYNNLEYELALGEHPPDHEQEAENALLHLDKHFPGVRDSARQLEEPPALSRSAGQRLSQQPERARERIDSRRARGRGAAPPRAQTSRRARGVARRAGRTLDTATGGWAGTLGDMFVWGIGLSIFYLILTRAAVAGKLALGASNVVRALVSPVVDPLNPKGVA